MLVAEVREHEFAVHGEGRTTLVTMFGHPSTGNPRSRNAEQKVPVHEEINAEDRSAFLEASMSGAHTSLVCSAADGASLKTMERGLFLGRFLKAAKIIENQPDLLQPPKKPLAATP